MAERQLTASERAQLFAISTRQNQQMLAKETTATTPATLEFNLPKTRLLSNMVVRIKGKLNLKHASGTNLYLDTFSIFNSIRRISLDLNNGFAPIVLSGQELLMSNLIDLHPHIFECSTVNGSYVQLDNNCKSSSAGTDNNFAITLQLTNALNKRDALGLILLQNDQTNVRLTIDFGNGSEVIGNASGYTAQLKDISAQVMLETFSIPANAQAYPDLSILQLKNGRTDALATAGQQIIKLQTGTIYRKIIFRVLDENNTPVEDDFITSDIQLVFNQADTNYSVAPEMLRVMNNYALGYPLPKGMYVFDFSSAGGFTGLGNSRDYIDSANLNEFWLKFNTSGKGKIQLVTETISRLS